METTPSTNGDNGQVEARDDKGRFLPGNPGGPGNPQVRKVAEIRSALLDTVTAGDLRAAIGKLVEKAKAGEPWAIRELLDRFYGKARQPVDLLPIREPSQDENDFARQAGALVDAALASAGTLEMAFPLPRIPRQ